MEVFSKLLRDTFKMFVFLKFTKYILILNSWMINFFSGGAIIVIVLILAAVRYFWRRHLSFQETAWNANGSTYCKMCRKNIARLDETAREDNPKSERQVANFYVNSTSDNSPTSTYSCSNHVKEEKSLKFNRHFNFMKTNSDQGQILQNYLCRNWTVVKNGKILMHYFRH